MPGTTEPVHLFEGVSVGNDGVFWFVVANSANTVINTTSEDVTVLIEDDDLQVVVDG